MLLCAQGRGHAEADGQATPIRPGGSFTLRSGTKHKVTNTGAAKLYCLTLMTPNKGFAELIRAGTLASMTPEDVAVIAGDR
jgi:mannose-6-phosphate isomerase-like protein (cupin superfamily)